MYAFVWQDATHVTDREHDEGGFFVVAASIERARELIAAPFCVARHWAYSGVVPCEMSDCRTKSSAMTDEPAATYELAGSPEESLVVFPDAGCC